MLNKVPARRLRADGDEKIGAHESEATVDNFNLAEPI
jgi:hypothetical protein